MATVVEGDQKAPFSIATTPGCRGGRYSFPNCSTLPLIRTLYCWVLSKEVSSTIFKLFGMTRNGIEPRSSGQLANTLPTRLMSRLYIYIYIYIYIYACVCVCVIEWKHIPGWRDGEYSNILHRNKSIMTT